jgi:hypothetical protein
MYAPEWGVRIRRVGVDMTRTHWHYVVMRYTNRYTINGHYVTAGEFRTRFGAMLAAYTLRERYADVETVSLTGRVR